MLVAVVDEPFFASPGDRDAFAAAAVKHFQEELALPLTVEKVELVQGAAPRAEVLGSVRHGGRLRRVLVSALAGEVRHAVVTFTAPSGRWQVLADSARASLDSYVDSGPRRMVSSRAAEAVAGAVALALVASVFLWRRRKSAAPTPG
jgi:hypothetical protein